MISIELYKNSWWIKLLMVNINTWNHLTVYKQIINIKLNY